MAGVRIASGALTVAFAYDGTVAVGDQVEIGDTRKVKRLTAAGRHKRVGEVISIRESLGECVCSVPFRQLCDSRVAGETVVPGPFVWGPGNTVHQYTPLRRVQHVGTAIGPVDIVADSNDVVKLGTGTDQAVTHTLSPGTGRTMASIAQELASAYPALTFEEVNGHLVVSTRLIDVLTIEAATNSAYSTLGWTAGIYSPGLNSHDASEIAGIVLVGGSAGSLVETLEY